VLKRGVRLLTSLKYRADSLIFPNGEIYPTRKRKDWLAFKNISLLKVLEVDEILDIGVFTNGTPNLYKSFPESFFHLIEPIPDLEVASLPSKFRSYNLGLGNRNERKLLNVADLSSSYEDRIKMAGIHPITTQIITEVVTLDTFYDEFLSKGKKYGIKIDTEGMELKILEGLTNPNFIREIQFFILEVSTRSRFKDGYRASNIFNWMGQNSFEFLTILNIPDQRNFFDIIFVKQQALELL